MSRRVIYVEQTVLDELAGKGATSYTTALCRHLRYMQGEI